MTDDFKTLADNAKFEQECFAQAKAELDTTANSGIDFCLRLLQRAQEIKLSRKALTIDEVLDRSGQK
jgi:hypothetical protein